MVTKDRQIIVAEFAFYLNISHGSAYQIIYDKLKFCKVWVRCVPRMLARTINKLGFETLKHPPYSPDLTSSYFHFFILKEALRDCRFASNMDVQNAMQKELHD
ncbi:hypothetical protein TNIN_327861 [Trichonephila inaurata madagascariensis]|uniref:Mariner Mos1 transposase n=1 Tax=Trichonephila inaurata madagascariensis TaxID=2747483 RepID=A0A8X6X2M3_9ARAC|nr:hypothetical protein TNIN_327861 [Trichonephila inaurata madagascariensis]